MRPHIPTISLLSAVVLLGCQEQGSAPTAPTESMPSAVTLSQQVVEVGDPVTIKATCKGLLESLTTGNVFTFAEVRVDFVEGDGVTLPCSPHPDFRRDGVFRHVSVVVDDVGGSWIVRIALFSGGADGLCSPFEGTTLPSGPMICTFLDSDLFTPFPTDVDRAFLESGVVVTMN